MIGVAGRARRTDQDSTCCLCVCKCDWQFQKTRLVLVIVCNLFTTVGSKLLATGATGTMPNFGIAVSLSNDGNTLAAGGWSDDSVRRMIAL